MMDNFNLDDVMQEGQQEDRQDPNVMPGGGADAPSFNVGSGQAQGPVRGLEQQLQRLQQEYQTLHEGLQHAYRNDYEGYLLDTNEKGQKYMGNKGWGRLQGDNLRLNDLRDQIQDLKQRVRDERSAAEKSTRSAADVAREVFQQGIKYENKNLRPEIKRQFEQQIRGVNWGTPELRSEQNKRSLMLMLFNHVATEARKARASELEGNRRDGASEYLDADTMDDTGEEEVDTNEFGHEKGSLAWKISEKYKSRRNANKVLGSKTRGDK